MFRFTFLPRASARGLALVAASMLGLGAATAQAPQLQPPSELQTILQAQFAPTHLAAATDVLRASGLTTMFDNSMPNVVGALRANVSRTRPELVKEIEESLKLVEAEGERLKGEGLSGASRFLANRLTEAELGEIRVFLTSPTGKKYVDTLPGFMEQVMPYLEVWAQETSARLARMFQEEMARRGHRL